MNDSPVPIKGGPTQWFGIKYQMDVTIFPTCNGHHMVVSEDFHGSFADLLRRCHQITDVLTILFSNHHHFTVTIHNRTRSDEYNVFTYSGGVVTDAEGRIVYMK